MTMGGRDAVGGKIQWDKLEQKWFDRIVETLLMRKFQSIAQVTLLDGRGGDGGVDASVAFPDGRTAIYQLKYYPEGMSGGHRGRRNEVKKSLIRAVTVHEPHQWILVTPRNYSGPELDFLRKLGAIIPEAKRVPSIQWIGRGELDQMLIDFPEVDRWLTLDHYRNTLELFERERRAFLYSPSADLANRVAQLGDLADSVDPDWTWDFERRSGLTIQTLRAQHESAAERSPITINFATSLASGDLAERLRKSIEFGFPEEIEIPGSAITAFQISGPELVSDLTNPDQLTLFSQPANDVPALGMLMELHFFEGDELVAAEEGVVAAAHRGTRGVTCLMNFCNERLTVKTAFAYAPAHGPTSLEVACRISGLSPRAVAALLSTVSRFRTSDEIELRIDGMRLARYDTTKSSSNVEDTWNEQIEIIQFAQDLASVLSFTSQNMTFPESYTSSDRIHARVARRLIDGNIVATPLIKGVTAHLSRDSKLTPELRSTLIGKRYTQWSVGPYLVTIAGRTFNLGETIAVHPESWVEDGAAVVESLVKGHPATDQLIVRPGDDPYFFAYLPTVDPQRYEDRTVVAWDLGGVEEPWLDRPWLGV